MFIPSTPAAGVAGSPLTYCIVVQNKGPSDINTATAVTVTDNWVSIDWAAGAWTCTAPGGCSKSSNTLPNENIVVSPNTFPASSSMVIQLTATVFGSTTASSIANTVSVATASPNVDTSTGDQVSTVTITLNKVTDFVVTKTFNGPGTLVPGQSLVTFSIDITNNVSLIISPFFHY